MKKDLKKQDNLPKQPTILVTGSAGFIGLYVCRMLLDKGYKIIGVDSLSSSSSDYKLKFARNNILRGHQNYLFKRVDITNYNALKSLFRRNELVGVCHLAELSNAEISVKEPLICEKTNNAGSLNIFELSKEFNVPRIIYLSSSAIYGNKKTTCVESECLGKPTSLYASTKRFVEDLADTYHHLYGIEAIGLRLFTIYGPYGRPDRALFDFTRKILADEEIEVYNKGSLSRDFTYVTDIAEGIVSTFEKKDLASGCINLGSSISVPVFKIITLIEKMTGKKAKIKSIPMPKGEIQKSVADIKKAKKVIGYIPQITIDEGLKSFVDWYRKYYGV